MHSTKVQGYIEIIKNSKKLFQNKIITYQCAIYHLVQIKIESCYHTWLVCLLFMFLASSCLHAQLHKIAYLCWPFHIYIYIYIYLQRFCLKKKKKINKENAMQQLSRVNFSILILCDLWELFLEYLKFVKVPLYYFSIFHIY